MRSKVWVSLATICLSLGVLSATALGEAVTNGGFETGDFTGWSVGGNTGFTGVVSSPGTPPSGAHSGTYWAALGPIGSNGVLLQATVSVIANQAYEFSFWLKNDGGVPNNFSAKFDGATLLNVSNLALQDWTEYSYVVVPTVNFGIIQFQYRNDPGFLGLDDVSLVETNAVPPNLVPVPMAAYAGLALLGVIGVHRKLRARPTDIA